MGGFRDASLTTTVRDHKVIFTKREKMPIWITEQQADALRAHTGNWVTIHEDMSNPDSPVLYDGKKINIDEIIPIDYEKLRELQGLRYICDYGLSHLAIEGCPCHGDYKCSGYVFSLYMDLKHGYNYASDIPKDVRDKFTAWAKDKKNVTDILLAEIKKIKEKPPVETI